MKKEQLEYKKGDILYACYPGTDTPRKIMINKITHPSAKNWRVLYETSLFIKNGPTTFAGIILTEGELKRANLKAQDIIRRKLSRFKERETIKQP